MWKVLSLIISCCVWLVCGQTTSLGSPVQTPLPPEEEPFRCEPITDIDLKLCTHVGYDNATFPNFRLQETQSEASNELRNFSPLIRLQCSNAIVHMLCAVYAPYCELRFNFRIPPCRNLCMHVRDGCEHNLLDFNLTWPPHLECDRYPTRADNPLCFGSSDPNDLVIPPEVLQLLGTATPDGTSTTQPNTTGAIPLSGAQFGEGTGPIFVENVQCIGNEARLLDCAPNAVESSVQNCDHSEDASVRCLRECTNGDVRLQGGQNAQEGRVEICNYQWGTVCDNVWNDNDANVVCRQLGFAPIGAVAFSNAQFGQGTGPIFLDNVLCSGTESRLVDCGHNGIGNHNCNHREDAGVRCLTLCTDGDIRLQDGQNLLEGRVEICSNFQWSTVCEDSWDTTDANVACRQLGFSPIGAIRSQFGQGTGPILLDEVQCTGNETRLVDCGHNGIGIHDYSHSQDAGVVCQSLCTNGDIRLQDGLTPVEGRVEVCSNSQWGSVCEDSWDVTDAIVVCRQLGLGITAVQIAQFGQGTGPIFLDGIQCTGIEDRLVDCDHNGIGVHNCTPSQHAGVDYVSCGSTVFVCNPSNAFQ